MNKMQRKGIMLVGLFLFSIVLVLPFTPVIAEGLQNGDPEIVYVESELRVPEEIKKLPGNSTVPDSVYLLDVKLKATERFASTANGTLSFKEDLRAFGSFNGFRPNRNLTITRNQTIWSALGADVSKSALDPFIITGLNCIPEKMTFQLALVSVNPHDQKEYSKSLEFTLLTSQTTIDILSISNPPDYYKGYTVPVNIVIKNTGSYATSGYLSIWVQVRSKYAGTTIAPYENKDGAIVLCDYKTFAVTIPAGQQRTLNFQIDYGGYSNGAMNVGDWKLIQVDAQAGNSNRDVVSEIDPDFSQHISDPDYSVCPRSKSQQPHPVFIYYLWNSGGSGGNWGGVNPKNYFINGYGAVKAGFWRFETSSSNIPVRLKMIICYDDSSWNIPSNLKNAEEDIMPHGRAYAGDQLKIIDYQGYDHDWYTTYGIFAYNCGFDVLLMAAGRKAEDAMGLSMPNGNNAIVCKSGPGTSSLRWRKNIDGLVQHELSHLFGCEDVVDGHPTIECIMVYGLGYDYLHEYIWLVFNPNATNNWCTCTSSHCCNPAFNANWDKFYSIAA